jgi:hypothetical protein
VSPQLFALVERLHGHVALLGLALLLHPVVALIRRPGVGRWTARTAWMGAALLTSTFAVGLWMYLDWRRHIKPGLVHAGDVAWVQFEVKEHLAALCVALAIGGAAVVQVAGRDPALRRTAIVLLSAAFVCGAGAGGVGAWVGASVWAAW